VQPSRFGEFRLLGNQLLRYPTANLRHLDCVLVPSMKHTRFASSYNLGYAGEPMKR
jgi:hypothetical protein